MIEADLLIHNAGQLVTCAGAAAKRGAALRDVGSIADGALAVRDGTIVAVGRSAELRATVRATQTLDAGGRAVLPGLIDAHTHVVYAGERIAEFEQRIAGVSYMQIMAAGGGIVSTMRATRAASVAQLVAESRPRLDAMLRLGTTTAEVKTGYGLDPLSELALLDAIAQLDRQHAIDLVPTLLAAHAVPPEQRADPARYVDQIVDQMIPQAADWYRRSHFAATGVPCFNDVFLEHNAFDLTQTRRVLTAGLAHGLRAKLHADEFTPLGGVGLAVELNAVSVDHLDVTGADDAARLAATDTIGVLLPAVNFNLGSHEFAPARLLIDAGVAPALATDINPGSAPCPSLPLVMAIACRYQRLLPAEALNACTLNAAWAIGLGDRLGSLEVGKQADIVLLHTADWRVLAYEFGGNPVAQVIKRGRLVVEQG